MMPQYEMKSKPWKGESDELLNIGVEL